MARPLAVLVSLLIMVGVLSSICAFLDAFATTTANINGRYIRFARYLTRQEFHYSCLVVSLDPCNLHGIVRSVA